MDAEQAAYVEQFRAIATDRLATLHQLQQDLRRSPGDAATVGAYLRELHTLKGEANMVEHMEIKAAAHKAEELLLYAKAQRFQVQAEVYDLLLAGLDLIGALLELQRGAGDALGLPAYLSHVDTVVGSAAAEPPGETLAAATAAAPEGADDAGSRARASIRVPLARVEHLTTLVSDLGLKTQGTHAELRTLLARGKEWRRQVEELQQLAGRVSAAARGDATVDALLAALRITLSQQYDTGAALLDGLGQVAELTGDVHRNITRLEDGVRELRLVPLIELFRRYPRAVRQLARQLNKLVEVRHTGHEAEVDSYVLEQLHEPMLHLVRNAAAHGIEHPADRLAAGKPETGTITMSAAQRGGSVEIRVTDDGCGIDPEEVRQAAVRRGAISHAQASAMGESDAIALIFRPGVSTRQVQDDIAGRGVGLDVVKERVEALGGELLVTTTRGVGTEFVLRIPVSAVLTRAMVVLAGGVQFAFPYEAVVRLGRTARRTWATLGSRQGVEVDGELLPVLDLAATLGIGGDTGAASPDTAMLIVRSLQQRAVVCVDSLVGSLEIFQRPLEPLVRGLRIFAGTALLKSGSHALLLNVAELVRTAAQDVGSGGRGRAEVQTRAEVTVLVVDDSEFVRDIVVSMLRRAGHTVLEAINGEDAWRVLQHQRPDLIITDLEMPILDGFALLQRVRGTPELAELPVIVFSTRGAEADKQRAAALGADAYLVKSGFREQEILATLQRCLAARHP